MTSYSSKAESKKGVAIVYILFGGLALMVHHLLAEGELSAILTLSAIFSTLAFCLLTVQVLTGNITGISAKTLQLEAISIVCRLSSTTWLNGYVPSDYTGDFLYQAFDFMALAAAVWIIHQLLYVRIDYDKEEDEFPIGRLILLCAVPAFIFQPDLNDRPLFDGLWMCSLNIGAVAACPQLWMMAHRKSRIQNLTAHFMGVMGFSRFLIGLYMWAAYDELTSAPWWARRDYDPEVHGEYHYAAPAVIAACIIHMVIIGDFTYCYMKNLATSGLASPLELNTVWEV